MILYFPAIAERMAASTAVDNRTMTGPTSPTLETPFPRAKNEFPKIGDRENRVFSGASEKRRDIACPFTSSV